MNLYYIRCVQQDYPKLLSLGQKLSAINVSSSEDGEAEVSATNGGAWDYIGEIPQAGSEVFEPIKDADGNPYIHVNLITPLALGEIAANMAGSDEEVAQALEDLGRFFLLDEAGNARAPSQPFRVFL